MVHISIPRKEADRIKENPGWSLVFGRRKVGKTYLIENFVPHDAYFYVRIDRSVSANGFVVSEIRDLSVLKEGVIDLLRSGRTVVIDEFQRLPLTIIEDISRVHPAGKLILTGSSMKVANEILGKNSPLLGLLRPFRIDMISSCDLVFSMKDILAPDRIIEYAPFLRDPWTIDFFHPSSFVRNILDMVPFTIPGLIGEVFTEDDRELSRTYGSILSLLGSGYTDYKEIGQILFSRGVVSSPASSSIIPYLRTMVDMGLLERIPRYGTRKFVYEISSFPIHAYYYLESRYGLSKAGFSFSEIEPTLSWIHDLAIERWMADLFAELLDGQKEYIKDRDREIDVLITKRGRPVLVGEVKWGKVRKSDISSFLDKVSDLECRKVIITRSKIESKGIEVLDPEALVGMVLEKDRKKSEDDRRGRY